MRDFLCRAKIDWEFPWYDDTSMETKEANNWVYGYFTLHSNCLPVGRPVIEALSDDYKVLEQTVCQSVGLVDDGGNNLYEGDVITDHEDFTALIKYADFGFYALCTDHNILSLTDLDTGFEIIGNIYDNPEWLNQFDLED